MPKRVAAQRRQLLLGLLALSCLLTGLILLIGTGSLRRLFHPAIPLTQPTRIIVVANQPWQDTGLALAAGQTIDIQYLSGSLMDATTVIADANGIDYICGQTDCCEPLPHARRSALIAQIGTETMLIGNAQRIRVAAAGILRVRINDCDEGLFDNRGKIEIGVAPATP